MLALAQEPLLQLLEPSLRIMIDKVPQARSRIAYRAAADLCRRSPRAMRRRPQTWMARHIRDFRKGYELAGIDLALRLHPEATPA